MEIKPLDGEVYTDMQELSDELPDNTPRYVLLSYPLTLVCGAEIKSVLTRVDMYGVCVEEVRSISSSVCDAQLYATDLLRGATDAIRGSEGAHAEY